MKRKITFLLAALLLMSGLTWAQTTLNIGDYASANNWTNGTQYLTAMVDDVTFTAAGGGNTGKYYSSDQSWRFYANENATLTISVPSGNSLVSVIPTFTIKDNGILVFEGETIASGTTVSVSGEEVVFNFSQSSGNKGKVFFTEIEVTYTSGGTPIPSITAANVEIAYDATSGAIEYTINNPVSGGSMTVSTEEEWISNPTIAGSAVNFTTTINQSGAPREGIITLAYTYGEQTITKPVTITQAGNPNIVNNISDITAAGYYSVQGTIVAINNRGFIVGDGTGYVYYYYGDNFEYGDYDIGDMVKLFGPVVVYGKVYEFNSSTTVTYVEESNYVEEAPIVLSGVDMDAQVASSSTDQLSSYVQYEGTFSINGTHYNITNIVGAQTAKGSISYPIDTTGFSSLDGKKVVVTGYYVGVSSNQYYNTMIGSIEEYSEPTITLGTYAINAPAAGTEGIINATYQNFEDDTYNLGLGVQFFEEDGETYTTCDWITAEIDTDLNVHYVVEANQGDSRMAYFKIEYSPYYEQEFPDIKSEPTWGPVGLVYSDLVTVTQAEYVAPTYAELPFSFDGGKADIANTDGLYQEGLDSDYSSSPKLKFNTAGDYVLLQFQEVPGTLTFDIKGNGSGSNPWEGVFKLMVSNDGSTFVEKAVYETGDLTSTKTTMTIDDLASEVRYIKWIYTTKTLGNVALGNIHLYEFGGGPVTEYDLTIEPFENLEIFTFVGGDENNPFEGAGTIQVTVGDQVMLSITANEGYEIQSLMVDGVEHVNDITDDATYTFTMPDHNVTVSATAVAVIPFEPVTYTLATTIEDGKTYIIVGKKTIDGVDSYYAMGEQRNKNRGGVAISVDGTTATVETAEVHEFIINGTAWIGPDFDINNEDQGVDYSIYDTNEASQGYLYAASSTENVLKTEAEPDENANWDITIDENGQFSVVARGSNTHNVMQFNYNGGNTLFSCYTSDSQLPVYLYVKNEETPAQTVALTAGTNWFSTYYDIPLADLQHALNEALPNATSMTIKSKNSTSRWNGSQWRNANGFVWDVAKMYMIVVPEDCELVLNGTLINPAEHTITIEAGTPTWIGFPFSESKTFSEAIPAGFAVNGDQIKYQNATARFNGTNWRGSAGFTGLEPGKGYMYVPASSVTTDRTLDYSTNAK